MERSKFKAGQPLQAAVAALDDPTAPEAEEVLMAMPELPPLDATYAEMTLSGGDAIIPEVDTRVVPELGQILRVDHLPGRLRNMIATLLAHQADLMRYETGEITLHFRHEMVRPHITLN